MQKKFNNRGRIYRLFSTLLLILILVFLFTVYANLAVLNYSKNYILNIDELKNIKYDTIIVLGAGVYEDGTPCPMLEDRLDTSIILFNKGTSDTILLTGDHGRKQYDEVNGMKKYILDRDIKKENVFLDHAGFSTYESMYRAKYIYEVKSALVTTQSFHLNRSIYIARKLGIDAYGISGDIRNYPKDELIRLNIREYLARVKDFLYVNILKPRPTYLGNKIPITGSSDITYDY